MALLRVINNHNSLPILGDFIFEVEDSKLKLTAKEVTAEGNVLEVRKEVNSKEEIIKNRSYSAIADLSETTTTIPSYEAASHNPRQKHQSFRDSAGLKGTHRCGRTSAGTGRLPRDGGHLVGNQPVVGGETALHGTVCQETGGRATTRTESRTGTASGCNTQYFPSATHGSNGRKRRWQTSSCLADSADFGQSSVQRTNHKI